MDQKGIRPGRSRLAFAAGILATGALILTASAGADAVHSMSSTVRAALWRESDAVLPREQLMLCFLGNMSLRRTVVVASAIRKSSSLERDVEHARPNRAGGEPQPRPEPGQPAPTPPTHIRASTHEVEVPAQPDP